MQQKKHKLKLRKWVVVSVPIAFVLTLFTIGFIVNRNVAFANTTSSKKVNAENKISEENNEEKTNTSILSNNIYVENLTYTLEKRKIDYTIIYYCNQFKINTSKVLEIAHNLTNNYEDEKFKETYVIAPANMYSSFGPYKTMEAGIVEYVRNIYRYPEKYGSSLSEMRVSEEIDTKRTIKDGHIILDSGLTFEQYLAKICEMYGIDKNLALAIVYQESGRMTSGLFTMSNNIGGQRGYAGWLKYPTLEAGTIGFVVSLNNMIENYNIDLSNPNAISELSSIYVNGHVGNPSVDWTGKINLFMESIKTNKVFE